MAACWLRVHALCPGFDERSCDAAGIDAANTAFREMLPCEHERLVSIPDVEMARRLCALREETQSMVSSQQHGVAVVAVVGAQHVPGVRKRIQASYEHATGS